MCSEEVVLFGFTFQRINIVSTVTFSLHGGCGVDSLVDCMGSKIWMDHEMGG